MLKPRMRLITLVLVFVLLISMVALGATEYFKVELGLFNRLVCLALLPEKGSFATLKIVRELQMEFAPSEEEYIAAGLKDDLLTGGVLAEKGWDKVEDKEITFGEVAKGLIIKALEELDESENLRQEHFDLYRWFVLDEKQEEEIKEGE